MLVYIHGFNSSAASFKARLLGERLAALGRSADYHCPDLPHRPAAAMALLDALIRRCTRPVTLVGSSLGGFYATHLAERYGVAAVLVNPAVRPYALLQGYLGPQRNLYTGAEYELTAGHLGELRALEVAAVTPERYLLMVATGDEVLDPSDALAFYRGADTVLVEGGDHGFADFGQYLDRVLGHADTRGRIPSRNA
jgi:predicted esterase YcpF (UPF0227 family)